MQVAKCPQCRKDIGGTNHNFANGNQGVATIEQHGNRNIIGITDMQRTDAVRGMDWSSSGGQDYGERDLEPLEYRILCLLLLIPLAVFSPRRNDRLAQLQRHWDAFKAVSGTSSDTEGQHLLVGILVRAAQDSDVVNALTMTGCDYGSFDMRLATETTFCTALRSVFNGQTPNKIVAEVQQRMDKIEDERQVSFVLIIRRLSYCMLATIVSHVCVVPLTNEYETWVTGHSQKSEKHTSDDYPPQKLNRNLRLEYSRLWNLSESETMLKNFTL